MEKRGAILTVLITLIVILGSALGIAIHQENFDPEYLLQFVWGTSAGAAFIGYMFRGGASTGGDVLDHEAVSATSMNRDGYLEADASDAQSGMAFGWLIMIPSLVIFGICLATLLLVY